MSDQSARLTAVLAVVARRRDFYKVERYFLDDGPLRRELLSSGRLKVFASCEAWFQEYRLYHPNEKGQIVKTNDHLMDATRYAVRSGRARMKAASPKLPARPAPLPEVSPRNSDLAWMA